MRIYPIFASLVGSWDTQLLYVRPLQREVTMMCGHMDHGYVPQMRGKDKVLVQIMEAARRVTSDRGRRSVVMFLQIMVPMQQAVVVVGVLQDSEAVTLPKCIGG
jgi:hypothetical protein